MLSRTLPLSILVALCAAPGALAAPATTGTVVYECKVIESVTAGKKTVYDDAARARPDLRQRFAFNVPAGRGCLIVGTECDPKVGRLIVEQDDSGIVGRSKTLPLTITYTLFRHSFVILNGDDYSASDYEDCSTIPLDVVLP